MIDRLMRTLIARQRIAACRQVRPNRLKDSRVESACSTRQNEEVVPFVSTRKPRMLEQSRGKVSSVDKRVSSGRGCRPADRSRGAADLQQSSVPHPTSFCGYFRFGVCCGLSFVPYSWNGS